MAIRPSLTGPTPIDWSVADRDPSNSGAIRQEGAKDKEESAILGRRNNPQSTQAAPSQTRVSGIGGKKVSGSTRTNGGSI